MGHRYGDSPEFIKALGYADELVGVVWQSVQYREKKFKEDWLIIVTTDHGRDPDTGKGHGRQSDRERSGWIYTNAKNLNEHFKNNQSAIVDIMPTIMRFMNLKPSVETGREIDGIPFIGNLSLSNPSISYQNGKTLIKWQAHQRSGNVKIWMAITNNIKTGGKDKYYIMKNVPLRNEKVFVNLQTMPSSFYKVFLEGDYNSVNRWIVTDLKKNN